MREDDELKRATELSLQGTNLNNLFVVHSRVLKVLVSFPMAPRRSTCKHPRAQCPNTTHPWSPPAEFNNSLPELLCSDEDSGNEDVLDMEYTEAEAEELKKNAEVLCSSLPTRWRLRAHDFFFCTSASKPFNPINSCPNTAHNTLSD